MKKILVSACLLGERCRYDGRSKSCDHPLLLKWKSEGRLITVCPEVDGGLPVPREPCERKNGGLFTESGKSFTEEYRRGAQAALKTAYENDVLLCILKERSPSCGVNEIYDGSFSGRRINGEGVAAELLRERGFAVFSENDIDAAGEMLQKYENGLA